MKKAQKPKQPLEVGYCEYGLVYIAKGKHKGKVGLYDDDDTHAIVYLNRPDENGYAMIRQSSLQKFDPKKHGKLLTHEMKCFLDANKNGPYSEYNNVEF